MVPYIPIVTIPNLSKIGLLALSILFGIGYNENMKSPYILAKRSKSKYMEMKGMEMVDKPKPKVDEVDKDDRVQELEMEKRYKELEGKVDPNRWYTIRETERIFQDDISSVWLRRVMTDEEGPFYGSRKKISRKNKKVWNILGSDILVHGRYLYSKELRRQERLSGKNKYYYVTPSKYVVKKMLTQIGEDDQLSPEQKEWMVGVVNRYKVIWADAHEVRMAKRLANKKVK